MAFQKKSLFKRIYIFLTIVGLLVAIISCDLNIINENDGTKNIQMYSRITTTTFSLLINKKDPGYSVKIVIISPCKWDEENKKYVLSD